MPYPGSQYLLLGIGNVVNEEYYPFGSLTGCLLFIPLADPKESLSWLLFNAKTLRREVARGEF